MKTFKDRLSARRKELRLSQDALAKRAGLSQTTISNIERGRNDGSKELVALAAALRVRPEWLADGRGFMTPGASNVDPGITLDDRMSIPVISYVQAGNWREIVDAFAPGAADEYVPSSASYGPATFALRVVGNSMAPDYVEGDIIIVDPDIAPRPGERVVAKNHREEATFKKYRPRGRNADGVEVYELVPLNDDYETLRSDLDQTTIIGTVMEHRRMTRR